MSDGFYDMTWTRIPPLLFVFCLLSWRPSPAQPLVELARPGPWDGVSKLIAYGDKLYFVNSQIYTNHNATDIYSYRLGAPSGVPAVRFEHRLFSQDAGDPARIDGLMYWPFEDPRFSTTHGEYAVSDGQIWQWRAAPAIRGFHVHAMHRHQEAIYALGSGWRGRIYRSTDRGHTWTQLYEHPTPDRQVSRVTMMASQNGTLYFGATAWAEGDTVKLLHLQGDHVVPVPGWPRGHAVRAIGTFRDQVYAVNHAGETSRVWRRRVGQPAQPVVALDDYQVRDFAATPTTFWAASNGPDGGLLWRSPDGLNWQQAQSLPALPVSLAVVDEQLFVGTYNPERGGALWGLANPQPFNNPEPSATLTRASRPTRPLSPAALKQAVQTLDDALYDDQHPQYRSRVLSAIFPLALSRDPAAGAALSERLKWTLPETIVSLIGGKVTIPAARLARWYLLFAVALNGHGHIPPALLTIPWDTPQNPAEKYFEPMPAAAWAVAELGQTDPETHAALRQALRGTAPTWAKGDVLLALHRLFGAPFQYPAP